MERLSIAFFHHQNQELTKYGSLQLRLGRFDVSDSGLVFDAPTLYLSFRSGTSAEYIQTSVVFFFAPVKHRPNPQQWPDGVKREQAQPTMVCV